MGRLFDAAAALIGVRQIVNYEAQAAIEMEAIADGREPGYYPFDREGKTIDPTPLFRQLVSDQRRGVASPVLAARFHSSIAVMVRDLCMDLRRMHGLNQVALSGGVWQNAFLLTLSVGLLQEAGFEIYIHRQVPTNDGGLSLGQVMVAMAWLKQ